MQRNRGEDNMLRYVIMAINRIVDINNNKMRVMYLNISVLYREQEMKYFFLKYGKLGERGNTRNFKNLHVTRVTESCKLQKYVFMS